VVAGGGIRVHTHWPEGDAGTRSWPTRYHQEADVPNGIFRNPPFHSHPSRTAASRARLAIRIRIPLRRSGLDGELAGDLGGRVGDRAAGRTQPRRDHPAAPEQVSHGFEEGFLRAPRSPETRRIGRFSTGVEQLPPSDRRGRFSDGGEQLPETPDKTAERRFSEGLEHKVVS
jgi:hypothetical protein